MEIGLRTANQRRFWLTSPRGAPRSVLAALALLGLALRALVPVGFDPAPGSFGLVLCPDVFPPGLVAKSAQPGTPANPASPAGQRSHGDPCIFCNSPSPGPVSLTVALAPRISLLAIGSVARFAPDPTGVWLVHIPPARAPPIPV